MEARPAHLAISILVMSARSSLAAWWRAVFPRWSVADTSAPLCISATLRQRHENRSAQGGNGTDPCQELDEDGLLLVPSAPKMGLITGFPRTDLDHELDEDGLVVRDGPHQSVHPRLVLAIHVGSLRRGCNKGLADRGVSASCAKKTSRWAPCAQFAFTALVLGSVAVVSRRKKRVGEISSTGNLETGSEGTGLIRMRDGAQKEMNHEEQGIPRPSKVAHPNTPSNSARANTVERPLKFGSSVPGPSRPNPTPALTLQGSLGHWIGSSLNLEHRTFYFSPYIAKQPRHVDRLIPEPWLLNHEPKPVAHLHCRAASGHR